MWDRFDQRAGVTRVQTVDRSATGRLGPVTTISAPNLAAEDPVFGFDARSNVVAVWLVGSDQETVPQGTARPRGGRFAPARFLTPPGAGAESLGIFVSPAGEATATWSQGLHVDAAAAAVRPPGGRFGPPRVFSPGGGDVNADVVEVAGDASGRVTALWFDRPVTGTARVQAAQRRPGGAFGPARTIAARSAASPFIELAFAVAPNGPAFGAWTTSTATAPLQAAIRPSATGAFGRPQNASRGRPGAAPAIATDGRGRALLVWTQAVGSSSSSGLSAAVSR